MQSAILYIRVSTDEQAEKGYSLRYQEDALRAYCLYHDIEILQLYSEDYSAKSFNRPTWARLYREVKKWKGPQQLIVLFTKWDRFSRNTADAYSMIQQLIQWNVQVQAIEQPIDLTVPENKLIFALYLAVPEVENDRRGIEVKKGMRKAQEIGKWVGGVPKGYKYIYTPRGEGMLVPCEPESSFIALAFNQLANSGAKVMDVLVELTRLGFKCSKSNFYRILQNPMYTGMVEISSDGDEPRKRVAGLHKALVTEDQFNRVQHKIGKPNSIVPVNRGPNPLRLMKGFICCNVCNRILSASSSTGRAGKRYDYYHCYTPGHTRIRVSNVLKEVTKFISHLRPQESYVQIFKAYTVEALKIKNSRFGLRQQSMIRRVDECLKKLEV